MIRFFIIIAIFTLLWTGSASAGESAGLERKVQTTFHADLASQVNPEGLQLFVGGYRRWISGMDQELGTPSSYLQTGMGLGASPAYTKAAIHGEWMPAVFAKVRLEYDFYRFFGDFGALLSFTSADSPFGRREVKAKEGQEESAWGRRVLLQPTLYAKAGPVIISNQTDLAYYRFSGNGPYFLDWEYDTLLKDGDSVIANRTQFLLKPWKRGQEAMLLVGPYYEVTRAHDADLTRQRLGGVLYWVPADKLGSVDRPRIYSQLGVNLQDRNRDNEMFFTIGVGFDYDL
ncbi:MAG: hypothetical protein AABZ10_06995 [Nitrospirota bacterium]